MTISLTPEEVTTIVLNWLKEQGTLREDISKYEIEAEIFDPTHGPAKVTEFRVRYVDRNNRKEETRKDTVANYLSEKYRFNRHGFADKVKEYLYAVNPLIVVCIPFESLDSEEGEFITPTHGRVTYEGFFRLQHIVDKIGWEKAKEIPEVRQLLQRTGTEGGRRIFNPLAPNNTFWIKLLFAELEQKYDVFTSGSYVSAGVESEVNLVTQFQSNIAISDARFDNEAEAIKSRGGLVILVDSNRPGLPEPDSHASEKGVSPNLIDGILHNDGTLEELYQGVEDMLDFIGFNKNK